jgi:hypothetical protein
MAGSSDLNASRRLFVKILGQSTVLIPIAGLSACGKSPTAASAGTAPPPPSGAAPGSTGMDAQAGEVANAAQPAASGSQLPHISVDDPAARALGYSFDAATVDNAKYPEHLKGQSCRKCAQFKGGPNDAWGPCMVFAGKQVDARGWCTAFVARPA